MNTKKILNSHFVGIRDSKVIEQNSDVLAILLPGIGYTLDSPLLYYSEHLAVEMGFDTLPIDYIFEASEKKIDSEEEIKSVTNAIYEVLKKSSYSKYKRIVFIGKSVGTLIQRVLQSKLEEENFKGIISNIYLTPIDMTVKLGLKENSLAAFGTSDDFISKDNILKIKQMNSIKYIEIKNAGHSLNIKNDIIKSIEILNEIILNEKEFLKCYI